MVHDPLPRSRARAQDAGGGGGAAAAPGAAAGARKYKRERELEDVVASLTKVAEKQRAEIEQLKRASGGGGARAHGTHAALW